MKLLDISMIKTMIAEAEGLSDNEYRKILDKEGPVRIGGFVFWPSAILADAPDYDDNGRVKARGAMFEESKRDYVEDIISKLKAQIKAEIDLIFDEEVIF